MDVATIQAIGSYIVAPICGAIVAAVFFWAVFK